MYISFIRPNLSMRQLFGIIAIYIYEKNKIENIQLEAGRIVTGTTRSIILQSLYKETG